MIHDIESYNRTMKESIVEEDLEEVAHIEINDNTECDFEYTKEKHKKLQDNLSKMIVRPWEEFSFKTNKHGLVYDKYNIFHIPYYSNLVYFVSARFLEEGNNIDNKCQHCHRVDHLETHCFDFHPCIHCGKTNHLSKKC